jgi:hypothetical protein
MSDYKKINEFASHLRSINGLYLFKIFTKYLEITDINRLFNFLAQRETEDNLRHLERLWEMFIKTGSIEEPQQVEEEECVTEKS